MKMRASLSGVPIESDDNFYVYIRLQIPGTFHRGTYRKTKHLKVRSKVEIRGLME